MRGKFITYKYQSKLPSRSDRHEVLIRAIKPKKTNLLQTNRTKYVPGKKVCFSNMMAKKQEFPAADSFLFWNADDVRPIRDRLDGFVCALPDSSCTQGGHRKLLKAPAPS